MIWEVLETNGVEEEERNDSVLVLKIQNRKKWNKEKN